MASQKMRRTDLRAVAATFDRARARVVIELKNDFSFGIPLSHLPEIAQASTSDLASVELLGGGNVLHWESLDADYSIPALLAMAMGRAQAARALGTRGGKARSDAKTAAARVNGAKGGRPRSVKT